MIWFDPRRRALVAETSGDHLPLTMAQARVVARLARDPGCLVSHDQLAEADISFEDHIKRVRAAVRGRWPDAGPVIECRRGQGYVWRGRVRRVVHLISGGPLITAAGLPMEADEAARVLRETHGEVPVARGTTADGRMATLYVAPSGSWSLLADSTRGLLIVASGEGWASV